MAIDYSAAANTHKRLIKELIHSSEQSILVRLPVPKVSVNVNPLFGDQTRESNATGETKGPYKCLWYDAFSIKGHSPLVRTESIVTKMIGQFREATAAAELWLDDIKIDKDTTWLDKAQDIIFNGTPYKMLAMTPIGLSVVAPYIAIVMLKGGAGTDA